VRLRIAEGGEGLAVGASARAKKPLAASRSRAMRQSVTSPKSTCRELNCATSSAPTGASQPCRSALESHQQRRAAKPRRWRKASCRGRSGQRQHLPDALAGRHQPVDEVIGGRAEVAAACGPGSEVGCSRIPERRRSSVVTARLASADACSTSTDCAGASIVPPAGTRPVAAASLESSTQRQRPAGSTQSCARARR